MNKKQHLVRIFKIWQAEKHKPFLWAVAVFCILLLHSCHSSRYIPEGEKLYTGAEIQVNKGTPKREAKKIREELSGLPRPRPNSTFMGMYVGLWAENRGSRPKAGPITRYLKRRYGEQPVLLSQLDTARNIQILSNRLENNGYFQAQVSAEIREKKKKANALYTVNPGPAKIMISYEYLGEMDDMGRLIVRSLRHSKIQPGVAYNLDMLKEERDRIERYLRDRSYYNFLGEYLIFKVDTNQTQANSFKLYLNLKRGIPADALAPYQIEKVRIFPNYSVSGDEQVKMDTVRFKDVYIIESDTFIKHEHLYRFLILLPGVPYNPRLQNFSSSRFSSTGTYRFSTIRYRVLPTDSLSQDSIKKLEANIYLSPFKKRSIRLEMQGLSKSNNFVGPLGMINYKNRNIFKGGEILQLVTRVGWETQFNRGQLTGLNSWEVGLEAAIIVPRAWLPFEIKTRPLPTLPNTRLAINYSILNRVQFYQLRSILLSLGYAWQGSRLVSHELHPISINLVNLRNTSEEFEAILESNPFLRRSFEQQFILGFNYTFQYNELWSTRMRNRFFILWNLDFSGNAAKGLQSLLGFTGEKNLFGQVYAQYSKSDVDIRRYMNVGKGGKIAVRLFAGAGISYGNSTAMPFIKQYFAGGPNSMRAFRIRGLGPGTYAPEVQDINSFFDQSGDIKLEANLEYRFPISGFLKGAVFAETGNIWLLRDNEALPGAQFTSEWHRQLAVGTGFGLRLDLNFFIIRLDLGIPVRKPFLPEGERWVRDFSFWEREWRRENFVWNLAIGYPF